MTKVSYILLFSCTIWSSTSAYYHEHDYMTDNLPYESALTVGVPGPDPPTEVTYSQPEHKKGSSQQMSEAPQWPPKPYFVVNRYIKQTLMPSIHKLPPDSVQNIATVSGIKVLEAASEAPENDQERAQQEIKYSLPVSPKYDANDWTPMHFARGVNRYSMPHKLPGLLDRHYPLPVSDDYANPLSQPPTHSVHSSSGHAPSNAHLQLTQEVPQYPRLPSLPSQLPQAAEEILPLQETYKGTFKSPEVYIEKMEHKDTPMKYIEKVIYRQIPTQVREMTGSEEDVGEEVPAHQYQQHHQIKHQPQHHQAPPSYHQTPPPYSEYQQRYQYHQISHELPVSVHSPHRSSGRQLPYMPHHLGPEPEEESEVMGEKAAVMFKLPFPKPKFRKVSADSIGALYSKLTCQQFRDPKQHGEDLEFDGEGENRESNYIYMFKNRLPH